MICKARPPSVQRRRSTYEIQSPRPNIPRPRDVLQTSELDCFETLDSGSRWLAFTQCFDRVTAGGGARRVNSSDQTQDKRDNSGQSNVDSTQMKRNVAERVNFPRQANQMVVIPEGASEDSQQYAGQGTQGSDDHAFNHEHCHDAAAPRPHCS